eukprot:5141815-Pyramimonas_sp.AAC.1
MAAELFRTPLEGFDAVIHLKPECLAHLHLAPKKGGTKRKHQEQGRCLRVYGSMGLRAGPNASTKSRVGVYGSTGLRVYGSTEMRCVRAGLPKASACGLVPRKLLKSGAGAARAALLVGFDP